MKRVDLNFRVFELHSQIIIGKMNEGIHYDVYKNNVFNNLIDKFYGTLKPFSFICIRDKNYSLDPMIHRYNSKYENFCSIAVVERNLMNKSTVQLESIFFKPGKFCKFLSVTEAILWANHQIALKRLETEKINLLN